MDAHVRNIRQILNSGDQWLVPEFQRHYSWKKEQWETLIDDIVALTKEEGEEHFLGPLVCTPFHPAPCVSPQHLLIDGQQRLMTISLALAALRDISRLAGLKDLAEEIEEDYLIFKRRSQEQGFQRLRVVPRAGQDRSEYLAAINGATTGTTEASGIAGAYSYFKRQWKELGADKGEEPAKRYLFATTVRLSLVIITINATTENPYEIFESLNTKNMPLEDSDVIRNFVFMQVPLDEQEAFERTHFQVFESLFEERPGYPKLPMSSFYRSYLMRNGSYCRKQSAFLEYKAQYLSRAIQPVEHVTELQKFATFELWLRRPRLYSNSGLVEPLMDIQALEVSKTAHPLLLNLLDRNAQGALKKDDLLGCFQDIESFVIRRWICREQTRGYDRLLTDAIKAIQANPQQDLQRYWLEHCWPTDEEFVPRLVEFPIYTSARQKCKLLLERLEKQHCHQEIIDLKHPNIEIEHVMPQTLGEDADGESWHKALGPDWRALHYKWVHTLGNLTLTGYNSELNNFSFEKKKQSLAESHLSLNRLFVPLPQWDAQAIKERGFELARIVARIWNRPDGGPPYVPPGPSLNGATGLSDEETVLPGKDAALKGRLRIMIRWPFLGVDRGEQTICEYQSSDSIVTFLAELIRVFGDTMKQQLTDLPVIRFPLSRNPADFLNSSTGKQFSSLQVPGTDLYFCSHSDNNEKLKRLRTLVSKLRLPDGKRFPDGSVQVSIADESIQKIALKERLDRMCDSV